MIENLTDEEKEIIYSYIFLPLVRRVLEKDRKLIESGQFKLKQPYIDVIDRAFLKVNDDIRKTRKTMLEKGIKIHKQDEQNFKVFYRGEHDCSFHPSIIRNNVEQRMKHYLGVNNPGIANGSK